jgi:hypothetical protein
MKLVSRSVVVALLFVTALGVVACGDDDGGIEPSGDVVTRTFVLTGFERVEVNTFDAEIQQSDEYSITVRVDDNLEEFVEADVRADTLDLSFQPDHPISGRLTLEAVITMPTIVGLGVTGAGSAEVTGFGPTDSLALAVSGASGVEGTLEATDVSLEVSGASSIDGEMTATNVDATVSGASSITLSGSADALDLDVSGASNGALSEFSVVTARVVLSGASHAIVNVEDEIDPVTVSGASTLQYLGEPDLTNVSTTGASTVEPAD